MANNNDGQQNYANDSASNLPFQSAGGDTQGGSTIDLSQELSQGAQSTQDGQSQAAKWLQHYQSGNTDQVPHDELHQTFNQWAQQATPEQVQDATHQGFQQVPQQAHAGIASTLLGFFQQHGLNPQHAGVQTTDPQQMTPQDMSKMTSYAQQQQPDAIGKMFKPGGALSNPMVGMAVAGALAYGLTRMNKK